MTNQTKANYRSARSHGKSISEAARKAGISIDQGYRLEGKHYCETCCGYVSEEDCAHWEF